MTPFESRVLDIVEETLRDPDTSQPVRDWLSVRIVPEVIAELRGTPARSVDGVSASARKSKLKRAKKAAVQATTEDGPKKVGGPAAGVKLPGLREAMQRAGMTAADLAEKLDVHSSSIGHWQACRYGVTGQRAGLIARILSVPVEKLTQEAAA